MKGTQHKSCSCDYCKAGRGTKAGQDIRKRNERKLRRITRQQLKQHGGDAIIAPISSPYTD